MTGVARRRGRIGIEASEVMWRREYTMCRLAGIIKVVKQRGGPLTKPLLTYTAGKGGAVSYYRHLIG